MRKTTITCIGISLCLNLTTALAADTQLRYSAANAITFKPSQVTKDFVGSAFLINHDSKTYGVTAKHVLLETMDQGLNSISTHGHIENWELRPFNENTGVVKLGQLLNDDAKEKLDIEVLQDDWLVFDVMSNESNLEILKLASKPLQKGEPVTVYGCNYSNQKVCQQNQLNGHYVKTAGVNLMIKLETDDMSQLRGLSGAPVLNQQHEVVGIVSNVVPDEDNGGMYFAPFSIETVKKFLSKNQHIN